MAAQKPILIGTASPVGQGGLPGGQAALLLRGKDPVWFHSDDPLVDVVLRLTGKPTASLPHPRYDNVERPGTFSLTRYRGHDPYEQSIPVMVDRAGNGIENVLGDLERLLERSRSTLEPPVVTVQGAGISHAGLKWRVTSIEEDPGRTEYLPDGRRSRMYCTVNLIQHVTDRLLAESIRDGKRAKGIRNRQTTARAGEDLYDVARRVFGDPSRASDIAKANPGVRLGQRFKKPRKLRLP